MELIDEKDMKYGRHYKEDIKNDISEEENEICIDYKEWKIFERRIHLSEIMYNLFLLHDNSKPYCPKKDGKYIYGVRCKDVPKNNGATKTVCIKCRESVWVAPTFKEDIEGAICYPCNTHMTKRLGRGHPETYIRITVVDKKSANLRIGARLRVTNRDVYRITMMDPFIRKYAPKAGDLIRFYFNLKNPSLMLVEIIKEYIKKDVKDDVVFVDKLEGSNIQNMQDTTKNDIGRVKTITLKCSTCGLVCELSNEELEDVSDFILKNKLQCVDILGYMNVKKGRVCGNKSHTFEFGSAFGDELMDIIKVYNGSSVVYKRYKEDIEELDEMMEKMKEKLHHLAQL